MMESVIEEEESRFFDAREEMASCSSASPGKIEYDESPLTMNPGDFQYDVWIKSPGNAEERREKFFKWMGLSSLTKTKSSNVDRSISETEVVLRSLKSDDEFSSCRCDSSVFSPRVSVDTIVKESLCKEDVDSGMVLKNLGFDDDDDNDISSSFCSGSSPVSGLTDRIVKENGEVMLSTEPLLSDEAGAEQQRYVGGIMKRVKEKWLGRLSKVRYKKRLGDDLGGEDAVLGSRIERVKVKEYKKEAKELSALFKGQEMQAHEGTILAMKFSPDGRYLASAGEDGVLRVWSIVEDERCEEHDVPKMDPSCIYFEVSKLSELRPVAVEKEGISGSLMSPTKTTESACVIIPPKIFRVLDKPLHEFLGHTGDILDISWSKNNVSLLF